MDSRFPLAVAAVIVTSAALYWGTGLHPQWWLTWLAPLPVLLISPRVTRWRSFWIAAAAWFLGSLNMWFYALTAILLPIPIVLLFSAVPSCFFGLGVLLFRRFLLRGDPWRAALSFPAFWVTCEYLSYVSSPNGTFPNLGYTQMDFLPVLQVTSVTGIWGIAFCLFLAPATVAAVLNPAGTVSQKKRLAAAAGAFLALAIGWGSWRVTSTPAPDRSVKVGLMATGVDTTFPHDDPTALKLLQDYSDKAASLAAQGAQAIVLPEKIALVSDQGAGQVDALYAATAARTKAQIVVGLDRGTLTKRFNEARLYSPQGTLAAIYDKHHMVPGFEDADQPGTTITVFDQPSGVWGIEICKDMDFPALSRQYGAKGVGLLLVPAWDFTLDAWLHGRMAVLRGVESGFTIVRAAKQGLLTVSDGRGRILAQQDAATVPFASLLATAPIRHDNTLYVRWGDWFAWLNIAGLIVLLFGRVPRSG
ncbi:MAG TPA: nitrilase-related carbon-nitrogen hydrolase [Bryobacteraceae bacterium]|nr:nitrilase-related carbon-nitrogen hydrolase [Bryobacteraceae bacterium]